MKNIPIKEITKFTLHDLVRFDEVEEPIELPKEYKMINRRERRRKKQSERYN